MKSYSYKNLFSVSALVCAISLASAGSIFQRGDGIINELRPYLSAEASIILPGDNYTIFEESTKRYITLFEPDIAAVVTVGIDTDVPKVIKYAKRKGQPILTGSARHGWAASLSNARNAILIDLTSLSSIEISADASTMTIGGGVTIGEVMNKLYAAGKETSTGVCPCVGFLGATLGGGHGQLQGLYGMMLDNLLSVDLVKADGEMITVSETSHADLFWGLRGAGHNFGIVTKAVYRIYDQTNNGLHFIAHITYDPEHIEALFTALNEFQQEPEITIFAVFSVGPSSKPVVALNYSSFTPTESALSQLESALGHIPYLSRDESVIPWNNDAGVGNGACENGGRANIGAASVKHYDIPTILSVYSDFEKFITENPSANLSAVIFETYAVQGVQAVDDASTAYALRQERFNVLLNIGLLDPSVDEAANLFVQKSVDAFHATGGFEKPVLYMNYVQKDEEFGALYGYDEWRRTKLTGLKRRYDPEGMFSWYNPVPFY